MYVELYRKVNDFERYIFLMVLLERNEFLFFKILMDYIEELMSIVYTLIVGFVCQKYGMIFRRFKGLFVFIYDFGYVAVFLVNWFIEDVKVYVLLIF